MIKGSTSKAWKETYWNKRKRKIKSETDYSTLIHNLDSSIIIPNKIARILNFNLYNNFDSVLTRDQIELDLKLYTHRVIAFELRRCHPTKTISNYEPRFQIHESL